MTRGFGARTPADRAAMTNEERVTDAVDYPHVELDCGPGFDRHLAQRMPATFRHSLAGHPALEHDAIAELAGLLGEELVTCETAVKPLVYADGAPEPGRVQRAADVVRNLDSNKSWLTLLNIENQSTYRRLVDDLLDGAARRAGIDPPTLRRRMGFIFASSPHSVTGAHFDVEHSLLLQLRGRRALSFGEFTDQASRDNEVARYWQGSFGKLTTMPTPSHDLTIGPGDGVYIPPYRPHWLSNGEDVSLSLTLTFFTRENETESLVQAFNGHLRRLGVSPRREGESAIRDAAKARLMRSYAAVRRRASLPKPAAR
jgi:hypothetical protein